MNIRIAAVIFVISVYLGAAVFSGVRTAYYVYNGLQPNIAPQMFIVFSPILATPIALFALIAHLKKLNYFRYDAYWQWFFAGISYSSILLGLLSPWLLLIPLVINPFSVRYLKV